MQARRNDLRDIRLEKSLFPHTGLWLDKFLPTQSAQGGENVYTPHFKAATEFPVSPLYDDFFKRWKAVLNAVGARTAIATARGRLVVGLGAESVLENAITLHRTYSVPCIPGSALKGLAAHYAHNYLDDNRWKEGGEAHRILFGDTASAGYVTFFDALYIPESAPQNRPLVFDVVAVHHPEYYRGTGSPPADWDSPNPVSFVSTQGKFLVALQGPDEWVKAAFKILALALQEAGIGAKTSSGYGRMELKLEDVPVPPSIKEAVVEPIQPKPEPPLTWRRGTVRQYRPDKGVGRLVDDETGEELSFQQEAIEEKGWSPGKKHKVRYAVVEQEGRPTIARIRRV